MSAMTPITPPTFAKSRGVKSDKVLHWIKTGELAAVNFATSPGGRPRWKIFPEAIADSERHRAAKATAEAEKENENSTLRVSEKTPAASGQAAAGVKGTAALWETKMGEMSA